MILANLEGIDIPAITPVINGLANYVSGRKVTKTTIKICKDVARKHGK